MPKVHEGRSTVVVSVSLDPKVVEMLDKKVASRNAAPGNWTRWTRTKLVEEAIAVHFPMSSNRHTQRRRSV